MNKILNYSWIFSNNASASGRAASTSQIRGSETRQRNNNTFLPLLETQPANNTNPSNNPPPNNRRWQSISNFFRNAWQRVRNTFSRKSGGDTPGGPGGDPPGDEQPGDEQPGGGFRRSIFNWLVNAWNYITTISRHIYDWVESALLYIYEALVDIVQQVMEYIREKLSDFQQWYHSRRGYYQF